ncbi:hypothetical protein ACS0TY_016778 [Phlomoides rotata]
MAVSDILIQFSVSISVECSRVISTFFTFSPCLGCVVVPGFTRGCCWLFGTNPLVGLVLS